MSEDSTRKERAEGNPATHVFESASDRAAAGGLEANDGHPTAAEISTQRRTAFASPRNRRLLMVGAGALGAVITLIGFLVWRSSGGTQPKQGTVAEAEANEKKAGEARDVELSPEAVSAAGIEIVGVTQRPAVARLLMTGAVETNQQQTQQVTPLVGGRVERVNVALGDRVAAGSVLATIASPEVAEMRGKLREAETRLQLAEHNFQRVQRAENRVSVLSAKAKLDEADATLRRTRRLIELGVGAGKDLISAEANYRTAKAEYEFQSNIALNRELQEARAEFQRAGTEVSHLRQSLRALGATDGGDSNAAVIALRAPASGTVTERLVNPGAGVEAGKPLFTIANISTMWVIANVPEAQVGSIHVGTPAEIRSAALGSGAIAGRVSYIDPQINQETRMARVRVQVTNPREQLKAGMFVQVAFEAGTGSGQGQELVIPTEAIQKVGDRTVVFIPEDNEPGHFKVRDIEIGGETEGYTRVLNGLEVGERVVTKGSFTLKTQMMKGEMGEGD